MFNWREYLQLAEHWATLPEEGNQRSAVSRAYYAVFCSCRNWIREHRPEVSLTNRGSVHQEVWKLFEYSGDKQLERIGQTLKRLRRARNQADYDDEAQFLSQSINQSLQDAELIFNLLSQLKPLPKNHS